jgi:hypothetical protein
MKKATAGGLFLCLMGATALRSKLRNKLRGSAESVA